MTEVAKDGFAWRRLKTLGFDALARAVVGNARLNGRQLMQLVNAPVPVLAKLIELRGAAGDQGKLAPVFYFPLAAAVEAGGAAEAAERCIESLLTTTAAESRAVSGLGIVIDRWTGDFAFETLAEAIALTNQRLMLENLAAPFFTGPSTGELKRIVRSGAESTANSLEQVFPLLTQAGINTIEGGTDLSVHDRALAAGFRTTIAHDLTRSRLAKAVLTAQPEAAKSQAVEAGMVHAPFEVGQQFASTLQDIARCLEAYPGRGVWTPAGSAALDVAAAAESPLGAELISAIAIARLLLPETISVRAPLSLMGVKAAHTALLFGADDLGFAALDGATAEQLALPLFAEIAATIPLTAPIKTAARELTQENTTAAEL